MIRFIKYIQDVFGSNYLGIEIQSSEIAPFLSQLKELIGDSYEEFTKNQQSRDKDGFHIDVMNVMEYNELNEKMGLDKFINSLDRVFKFEVSDVKLLGIGKSEKHGNQSYYVVVRSEQLQDIRQHYGLPEQDFHVTIGFKHKDVYGVRKNEVLKSKSNFLQQLKKSYEKEDESFEFIKGIKNFDGDFYKLIEPIKINDTNAIFRIGIDYYQVSLVDDSLLITGKWQDENDSPIISDVLIKKKFKN
jgi:hypothetical protein